MADDSTRDGSSAIGAAAGLTAAPLMEVTEVGG